MAGSCYDSEDKSGNSRAYRWQTSMVISLDIARVLRLFSLCNQVLLGMDPFGMFANWRMHTFSSLCLLLSMLPLRSQAQRTYRLNHVSRVECSKERFDASIWKDAFGFTRLVNSYNWCNNVQHFDWSFQRGPTLRETYLCSQNRRSRPQVLLLGFPKTGNSLFIPIPSDGFEIPIIILPL